MKLVVEGFRVYAKRTTFHLPDEGLTLLYGDNGIGKTTLLKALVYVLFGVCKNPVTWNGKGCSVELTVSRKKKVYTISRTTSTSRPNTLTFKINDTIHTAQEAQHLNARRSGCRRLNR